MRGSRLLILGFVLNAAHCLAMQDTGEMSDTEIKRNLIGILGEVVHLSCQYLGENTITNALWKSQRNSKAKMKRLTGFSNGKPFSHDADFSLPASPTNLTVEMTVSSLEAEGEYICVFVSEEEEFSDSMFLTVLVRPDTHIWVKEEIVNGTHYQSVLCSAVNGRPKPQISWLIHGIPPYGDHFTKEIVEIIHPNETYTVSSILRFPTHLQDEDSVTCVVQHPTIAESKLITVTVDTYVAPNVSLKVERVQGTARYVWVVSCTAFGGRPKTNISLIRATNEELQSEEELGSETQTSKYHLPADTYEGHNITCVFDHPKFTHKESRRITLPSFYLSGLQLVHSGIKDTGDNIHAIKSLEVEEGQTNASIGLEVIGNVPYYSTYCNKDDKSLPNGVEVVGSVFTIHGPVELEHAGLYQCVSYYQRHRALIQFNITVEPQVIKPVVVPPVIRMSTQNGAADRVIECSAADSVPAANVSWLLPEGVPGDSWFSSTTSNGSHSVRGVVVLPACSPREFTVECVINHPAFEKPENRSIALPPCAPVNISINSSVAWLGEEEYTTVECIVDSVSPAANITWRVGDSDSSDVYQGEVEWRHEVQAGGLVKAYSAVRLLSFEYSGQSLTCVTEHSGLEVPEERKIQIPVIEAPVVTVSLVRRQGSPLWQAVCHYRGQGARADLAWRLPENITGQTSLHTEGEGHTQETKLTYEFPLALLEGKDLACVIQYQHRKPETRTIHIPSYYISKLTVLNHTTLLQSRYGSDRAIQRLSLQKDLHNQNILLHVNGNVPTYNLTCQRSDGLPVHLEGVALVFESEVTEQDEALYTCRASFFHHQATVYIEVEVTSEEEEFLIVIFICISTAVAILLFSIVALWVFCKINNGTQPKKRESLAALTSLMQGPCSPEMKKATIPGDEQEYTKLVGYSIVIDVKSRV